MRRLFLSFLSGVLLLATTGEAFAAATLLNGAQINRVWPLTNNGGQSGLQVLGTYSGTNLYSVKSITGTDLYAVRIAGGGLVSCSNASTSKLLWNSATKLFSCGTDTDTDTNTTYTGGQGLSLGGTAFSVNSTLTGTMLRFLTLSGSTVFAKSRLTSSGTLKVLGNMSGASLNVNNLLSCTNLQTDSAGAVSCNSTVYLTADQTKAGQGLGLSSNVLTLNSTITGSLVRFTTISGSTVFGLTSVRSSGALTWEGVGSGASLYVGTNFQGAGLTDCTGGNALRWTAASGRFSCAADAGTTYIAGQGLTLTSTSFKVNATLTGSLAKFGTMSGNTINAQSSLSSSGTLTIKGIARFQNNVNVVGTLSGAGLTIMNGTSYVLGNLAVGKTSATTKLDVPGTISGSVVWAGSLRSSGGLVVEGTSSGSLFVARSFSGTHPRFAYAPSPSCPTILMSSTGSAIGVGSGKTYMMPIPMTMSGYKVSYVLASVVTAGTTNSTSFQLRNIMKGGRKILSTVVSIDTGQKDSFNAGTPFVINSANAEVGFRDQLAIDVTNVSTTAPKGGAIQVCFKGPAG